MYLCVCGDKELEKGAVYLDGAVQPKHMAGPFFSEGTFTKNDRLEVNEMLRMVRLWSTAELRPSASELQRQYFISKPLQPLQCAIDLDRYMGRWYVLASIPTALEKGATNGIETYKWGENRQYIKGQLEYYSADEIHKSSKSRGRISNAPYNTQWSMELKKGFYLPLELLGLSYVILYVDEEYECSLVSVPSRSYAWVLTRPRPVYTDRAGVQAEAIDGQTLWYADEAARQAELQRREVQEAMLANAMDRARDAGIDVSKIRLMPYSSLRSLDQQSSVVDPTADTTVDATADASGEEDPTKLVAKHFGLTGFG